MQIQWTDDRPTVSIHAPLRREERPAANDSPNFFVRVSIHAPLRREERRPAPIAQPPNVEFQSTPPSEERSDGQMTPGGVENRSFNPRPPPKRGATSALCRSWVPN